MLGLDQDVRREAWYRSELRLYSPDGTHVSLHGEFACLPRERLDAILLDAAVAAGARFVHGAGRTPLLDGGRVVGASVTAERVERPIRARVTILAAGANLTTLKAFGVPGPMKPEAVAGRAYFQAPATLGSEIEHLVIAYQRDWCPGYGWISRPLEDASISASACSAPRPLAEDCISSLTFSAAPFHRQRGCWPARPACARFGVPQSGVASSSHRSAVRAACGR